MKKLSLLILPLLLLAAGCTSAAGPAVGGKTYISTETTGFELVEGTSVSVTFRDDEISVNAGCNTTFGPVSWKGSELQVGDLAGTEIGCPGELHDQDDLLTDLLISKPTFTLSDTTLAIAGTAAGSDVTITLEELQDAALAGTTWVLNGILANMGVSSLPEGVRATLVFDGDRANLEYGCNTGGGSVTVGEGTLEFGPLMSTRMMCPPDAMEVEEHVMSVLEGKVTYEIDGNSLHIENGEIGLRYIAE